MIDSVYQMIKSRFKVKNLSLEKNKIILDDYYLSIYTKGSFITLKITCNEWQLTRTYSKLDKNNKLLSQDNIIDKIYKTILCCIYNNNLDYIINNTNDKISLF